MNKFCTAVFLGLWLLFSIGCSSIPAGTMAIKDILANPAQKLGQEVVAVGIAETRTSMTSFKMFKLYQSSDSIWVTLPAETEEPPQGIKVRVTGPLQEKEFTIIGKVFYIEATKVAME
jgi:hypothetical protein